MILAIFLFFFLILSAISLLYFLWMIDIIFGEEDCKTSQEAIKQIGDILIEHHRQNGLLYDLGSCRGDFVFGISRVCPNLRVVGLDKSWLRICFSRLFSFFFKRKNFPKFLKADIFKTDISAADVVFVYLPRPLLPALEAKLQKELKPRAMVVTYRVNFPTWSSSQVYRTDLRLRDKNNIFVYKKAVDNNI